MNLMNDWKRGSFDCAYPSGKVLVVGWVRGAFGIDKRNWPLYWYVTHLPTGYLLGPYAAWPSLKRAQRFCDALMRRGKWLSTKSAIPGNRATKQLQKACHLSADEIGEKRRCVKAIA